MKKFFGLVVGFPRTTLLIFTLLTVFFLLQIPRIRVETDLKNWLPEGHPEVEFFDEIREQFGLASRVVICVEHDGPAAYSIPTRLRLYPV